MKNNFIDKYIKLFIINKTLIDCITFIISFLLYIFIYNKKLQLTYYFITGFIYRFIKITSY